MARLFHRVLSAIFLVAWISLGVQVRVLIGSRGLLPLADFVEAMRGQDLIRPWNFPSWLALVPGATGDAALRAGIWVGVALSLVGLAGLRPRLVAALQTGLYLGYAIACRTFLGFQWDNLLLECGLLAAFLPVHRAAPVAHFLLRALLFKLYFESGIAKYQSPLGDWLDGSAMTTYYETAPLPTALAWTMHHLPRAWHVFESWTTLVLELAVPFAAFGARGLRLVAAVLFTGFQIINAATANYGFFCYLALGLHLFLIDDADARHFGAWVERRVSALAGRTRLTRLTWPIRLRRGTGGEANGRRGRSGVWIRRGLAAAGAAAWLAVSGTEALFHFGDPGPRAERLVPVLDLAQTFRVVNAYHLFAAVTRERIEPEVQVKLRPGQPPPRNQNEADAGADGDAGWTALDFRYKPGDVRRAPPFVAPHQPRVDFQLWFYGLAFQRRQPAYVSELLARLCEEPAAVADLFPAAPTVALVSAPAAVRLVFWEYHFTTRDEKRATGAWWSRRRVAAAPPMICPER